MLATLFDNGFVLMVALAASLLGFLLLRNALRLRQRTEFERHLLELLHLATRREHALVPLLRKAAMDARKQERAWLEQIAERLENGCMLHEAITANRSSGMPRHVVAAVEAAEGTARLPDVLHDLAHRSDRASQLRYKVLLAISYPTLLSLMLLGLGSFWLFASWTPDSLATHQVPIGSWATGIAITCSVIWLLVAFGWGSSLWSRTVAILARSLPWLGPRLRLLPAARALSTASNLIANGTTLPQALRQAAHTTADPRSSRGLLNAAELAEQGSVPEQYWQQSGLPKFAVAQLLSSNRTPAQLGQQLALLAQQCEQRCADAMQRSIAILQPMVVISLGLLIALQFSNLIGWIDGFRQQAAEQLPW